MNSEQFFEKLWLDYVHLAPQAELVRQLFLKDNRKVVNDHVAFRTFSATPLQLDNLVPLIESMGYQFQADYDFSAKKLRACSYIHPDPSVPKIFCSELLTEQLSTKSQNIIQDYTQQIVEQPLSLEVFWSGRHWSMPSYQDYQTLMEESEYGAWLLALGIRVNHFTLSINHLKSINSISQVIERVKNAGFVVNSVGGEVKGTPSDLLEQGSTMADQQAFVFADGATYQIPTCFYEFAKRYPDSKGNIYQGFVAANADKIFESTHAKK
ncbi:DUF1338 domain-containing protein [Pelagibaculum spongiae]|uniref:2-oxoadipate dioxygenase/decarboxylase n=1 Tax=Pelagibaculum spongiae TaxID=2080658 RepID=A0A2V1H0N0_9GAMM|nr:DUF1338 domain-containing protein [Pelagibaculum spongiae]PVZ72199.1 DUF1338 domain-containing protein [Pelagibaculum spongiae]